MTVDRETELVIEQTAYRVADEVCKRYETARETAMKLHEAECPGRRVGKGIVAFVSILSACLGAIITAIIKGWLTNS